MSTPRSTRSEVRGLRELAQAHGIQTRYVDIEGTERIASPDSLLAALRAMGVGDARPDRLEDALWERQEELGRRLVEPVTVCWEGEPPVVELNLPGDDRDHRVECRLVTEGGDEVEWSVEWSSGTARIELPDELARGYHDLSVSVAGRSGATRVIRAPRTAWDPERRDWGVFLPLYALRTRRSWGVGDLGDLAELRDWVTSLGGRAVATLPLLSAFLDRPQPSPYAPVSRLFWNELYVDPTRAPGLEESGEARELLGSAAVRREMRALRRSDLVDYAAVARLKRRVLEALEKAFHARGGHRSESFSDFVSSTPEAPAYAGFRAACERRERGWRDWSPRPRDGDLQPGDYAEPAVRYHLYAQWLAHRQLDEQEDFFLDMPLGVHPDGFDTWRWPELFVDGVSAGAPPDDFFREGQQWGLPPLHPERIREGGYRYPIAALETLCRRADTLRIDHVMAFHRLFWVPRGMPATDGVYVRYRPEEWWAIACLESHRHRTAIVGEDLGTVPDEVREAMARHHVRRTWVLPFVLEQEPPRLEPPPERAVASFGTHDMPPFAAWWEKLPPARRRALVTALEAAGALPPDSGEESPGSRHVRRVLEAVLRWMSDGNSRLVVVNLEDLWFETKPQNVPGTTMEERPNWRRKARFSFEMFREMPEVVEVLKKIDRWRGKTEGGEKE